MTGRLRNGDEPTRGRVWKRKGKGGGGGWHVRGEQREEERERTCKANTPVNATALKACSSASSLSAVRTGSLALR